MTGRQTPNYLLTGRGQHDVQWSYSTTSRAGAVSKLFVVSMILIISVACRSLFLRPQNYIVRSWERLSLVDPVRLTRPSYPVTSGKGLFLFVEAGIHMSGRRLVAEAPILSSRCRNLCSVLGMTSEHYRGVRQKGYILSSPPLFCCTTFRRTSLITAYV